MPRAGIAAGTAVSGRGHAASVALRSPGTGENRTHKVALAMPTAPITIAHQALRYVATTPPASAPSGSTPQEISLYAALTRPRNSGSVATWRTVTACELAIPIPTPMTKKTAPSNTPAAPPAGPAAAVATGAVLPATSVTSSTRPYPQRPAIRVPNQAPANDPAPPATTMAPSPAAGMPRSRTT